MTLNIQQQPKSPEALAARMRALLEKSGISATEIKCYGSQIVITAKGYKHACKWFCLLGNLCSIVRGPKESWEVKKATKERTRPRYYKVWRVYGTV